MIREITSDDAELLAEMHKICFEDSWSLKSMQETLISNTSFGFLNYQNVARGFILCKMVYDEIEILTFCVLQEFRNRGIGKMLLKEIDNYACVLSVKTIFLEVAENNLIAKKTYEKSGYEIAYKRNGYYQRTNETALVMRKVLS
ncbi:MAG: ribosomal protein S18-alanine N-acetyltransferase [Holosporaceae bacterium]|jgi:ribosomal-protein-alanine N-acetyltransferase|nr:ribosomal protein S18-alanine N-acetyltransferase [Holosporaceae bacterium]